MGGGGEEPWKLGSLRESGRLSPWPDATSALGLQSWSLSVTLKITVLVWRAGLLSATGDGVPALPGGAPVQRRHSFHPSKVFCFDPS